MISKIKFCLIVIIMAAIVCSYAWHSALAAPETGEKENVRVGGPQLGSPGGGPVIDKSGDPVLRKMTRELLPLFHEGVFWDEQTGKELKYTLFVPNNISPGKKYPLVLFMADASTPGTDVTRPLTQGYGALVWATPESQKRNPCYVLVPQFSGVAVNDAYERTDEVDLVMRLLEKIIGENNVDRNRLYATGQSMGGMISMYLNISHPRLFAASLFVDCHWDTSKFNVLAENVFVYITAGNKGKSFGNMEALEKAANEDGRRFSYAQWSAKLSQVEQDQLAEAMLKKGAPINIINFTPGSVLPVDGKGSEHMYSFDYAYRLAPVREWIFRQSNASSSR